MKGEQEMIRKINKKVARENNKEGATEIDRDS
jgi:hypothetical protein